MFIDTEGNSKSRAPEERNVLSPRFESATLRSSRAANNFIEHVDYKHCVPPGLVGSGGKPCSKKQKQRTWYAEKACKIDYYLPQSAGCKALAKVLIYYKSHATKASGPIVF